MFSLWDFLRQCVNMLMICVVMMSSSVPVSDDFNRVILSMRRGQEFTDYINASFIDVSRFYHLMSSFLCILSAPQELPVKCTLINLYKAEECVFCFLLRRRATDRRTTSSPPRALCHTQWRISGGWCGSGSVTPLSCSQSSRRGSRWATVADDLKPNYDWELQ